jgi:ATP-dependent Lhr-like helicase
LLPPRPHHDELSEREAAILDALRASGASFFAPLHDALGGGYPAETVDALWSLVWRGLITNDTFHALRAFTRSQPSRRAARRLGHPTAAFRSRRLAPPSAEGRWALVNRGSRKPVATDTTKWAAATTQQLLNRHGVLTREAVAAENIPGGFGLIYPVLKGLEDTGRIRRGYFVAGLGATQFALPGALDLLRSLRDAADEPEVVVLAATDPANPYGATLRWSSHSKPSHSSRGPTRSVGATVILVNGGLAAYVARGDRVVTTFLPDAEPERSKTARAIAAALIDRARSGADAPRGMLIEEVDGSPASLHPLAPFLVDAGFVSGAMGMQPTPSSVESRLSVEGRSSVTKLPATPLGSRRPFRSTVSSPFASRYFTDDSETDSTDD